MDKITQNSLSAVAQNENDHVWAEQAKIRVVCQCKTYILYFLLSGCFGHFSWYVHMLVELQSHYLDLWVWLKNNM